MVSCLLSSCKLFNIVLPLAKRLSRSNRTPAAVSEVPYKSREDTVEVVKSCDSEATLASVTPGLSVNDMAESEVLHLSE